MRYASLRQGLVGCWCPSVSGPFGYRLPDLSGYGNHGTLTNMDPGTDWVTSGGKGALDFDGSNDYVATNATTGVLEFDSPLTISAWVLSTDISSNRSFVAKSAGIGGVYQYQGYAFEFYLSKLRFAAAGINVFGGDYIDLMSNQSLSSNVLYHVVVTAKKMVASETKLFINGNSVAYSISANGLSSTIKVSANFAIGSNYNNSTYHKGIVDDIRIYNRALSESEIRLLASGRGVGLIPERQRNRYQVPPQQPRNRSSRFLSFPA